MEALADARNRHNVDPLFIHAIYLINLASGNEELRSRSCRSLIATLKAGSVLGARGVVTHIGSHAGQGFEVVADRVARGLRYVLEESPADVQLLLENSAGSGGIIGSSLHELADLIDRAGGHPRLGVTLDTAHLCGAGWDLKEDGEPARLTEEVRATFGLDRLDLLHANDSKVPVGSRRDRHAVIGDGHIGLDGFRGILMQSELTNIPWILETPDLDTALPPENRFVSLATVRRLAAEVPGFAAGSPLP